MVPTGQFLRRRYEVVLAIPMPVTNQTVLAVPSPTLPSEVGLPLPMRHKFKVTKCEYIFRYRVDKRA
jgi:hypothetical protein